VLSDLTDQLEIVHVNGRKMRGTAPDLETANRIASKVLDCGGRLVSFTPHRETLEDVFLREMARTGAPEAARSQPPAKAPHSAAAPAVPAGTRADTPTFEEAPR
jgi:hypothetical protein